MKNIDNDSEEVILNLFLNEIGAKKLTKEFLKNNLHFKEDTEKKYVPEKTYKIKAYLDEIENNLTEIKEFKSKEKIKDFFLPTLICLSTVTLLIFFFTKSFIPLLFIILSPFIANELKNLTYPNENKLKEQIKSLSSYKYIKTIYFNRINIENAQKIVLNFNEINLSHTKKLNKKFYFPVEKIESWTQDQVKFAFLVDAIFLTNRLNSDPDDNNSTVETFKHLNTHFNSDYFNEEINRLEIEAAKERFYIYCLIGVYESIPFHYLNEEDVVRHNSFLKRFQSDKKLYTEEEEKQFMDYLYSVTMLRRGERNKFIKILLKISNDDHLNTTLNTLLSGEVKNDGISIKELNQVLKKLTKNLFRF